MSSPQVRGAARPTIVFEPDADGGSVVVRGISPVEMAAMRDADPHRSGLRVTVAHDDDLPPVLGDCSVEGATLRFTPRFPFEPGLTYRATFACGSADGTALAFSRPSSVTAPPSEVTRIHPTAERLPANLLRFHVAFSAPMQRGRAAAEIAVLDADGAVVPDVLYRPPVELWDRDMRYLTVLLDPGRLKRLVSPNRALGPPLVVGGHYTLRVGRGMRDDAGRPLCAAADKAFVVDEAVRTPIDIARWTVGRPAAATREPLTIVFPRPLDWASLARSVAVVSANGAPVPGRSTIDGAETRWCFEPTRDWQEGGYRIRVATGLEDVCGNGPNSAFDRPLASTLGTTPADGDRSIAITVSRRPRAVA